MNKLIQELAKQADDGYTGNNGDDMGHALVGDDAIEKFAELIVRECVSIGDNYQDILGNEPECFNCRKVAYGIADKIKQHFGVGK